jgi:hypothetical protein
MEREPVPARDSLRYVCDLVCRGEDETGRPSVGQAGRLLDAMNEAIRPRLG